MGVGKRVVLACPQARIARSAPLFTADGPFTPNLYKKSCSRVRLSESSSIVMPSVRIDAPLVERMERSDTPSAPTRERAKSYEFDQDEPTASCRADACGLRLCVTRLLLRGCAGCTAALQEAVASAQGDDDASTRADVLRTLGERIGPAPSRSWEDEYEALNLEY